MARNKEKGYIGTYKSAGDKKKMKSAMELRRQSFGENLSFAASEAYKLLRTNLMFSMSDESECKVVGVTSALRGEGKSTTAVNLANKYNEIYATIGYLPEILQQEYIKNNAAKGWRMETI